MDRMPDRGINPLKGMSKGNDIEQYSRWNRDHDREDCYSDHGQRHGRSKKYEDQGKDKKYKHIDLDRVHGWSYEPTDAADDSDDEHMNNQRDTYRKDEDQSSVERNSTHQDQRNHNVRDNNKRDERKRDRERFDGYSHRDEEWDLDDEDSKGERFDHKNKDRDKTGWNH